MCLIQNQFDSDIILVDCLTFMENEKNSIKRNKRKNKVSTENDREVGVKTDNKTKKNQAKRFFRQRLNTRSHS